MWLKTVSYTHLDVYKRQAIDRASAETGFNLFQVDADEVALAEQPLHKTFELRFTCITVTYTEQCLFHPPALDAVSYTHLFQTENQQEVFEQFCKQYFPDRLEDRYTEGGYFDFHASAFGGKEDGVDGILLRTDIARHPAVLKHILLHELAHIFCTRNEIDGDNFFERYCMDDTISREEDGTINAGYAVWRELIAELIAFELDDNCDVIPIRRKKDLLSYYEGELLTGNGKMGVSMILCEAMTLSLIHI